jgi:trigger factor
MNLNVEQTGPLERRLQIKVPTADVDRAFETVFRDLRKSAQVRGFRPGKAPRNVLEKQFGEHARGEVLEVLVRETLFKAIEQAQLDIVAEPKVNSAPPPRSGEAYAYEATVEIRPTIELKQVEGLRVDVPRAAEPEEDPVEAHLRELRERHAELVAEEAGTAAARGHVAVLDFEGTVDGQPFEGGSGREVALDLGSGRAVPGFEDAIIGMTQGQTREFPITFPDDYPPEALRGRAATFTATLQELKRRELPALDDEFAKDVSEYDSLDELRAELRRRLDERREQERQRNIREGVIHAVIEANPFPLPPSLVHAQLHALMDRLLEQLGPRVGEARRKELADRWHHELHPQAERDTALAFLVPSIARAHGIEVGEEEIDAQLAQLAEGEGQSVAQVKRMFTERNALVGLRASLLERKVVDFLVSKAILAAP